MIIAVDFDGTLCKNAYPKIGEPKQKVIDFVKEMGKTNILILWTCRVGILLEEAILWCKDQGIEFDYINEHEKQHLKEYDNIDTRKIYADMYIDDKNISLKDIEDCQQSDDVSPKDCQKDREIEKLQSQLQVLYENNKYLINLLEEKSLYKLYIKYKEENAEYEKSQKQIVRYSRFTVDETIKKFTDELEQELKNEETKVKESYGVSETVGLNIALRKIIELKNKRLQLKSVCPICGCEMDESYLGRQYCSNCDIKLKGDNQNEEEIR